MTQLCQASADPFPKVIGFLAPSVSDGNGFAIWSGIVEAAQQRGMRAIAYAGSELREITDPDHTANLAYTLVHPPALDGLIVWVSSLSSFLGVGAVQHLCRSFDGLPMVSIGEVLPGTPSIVLDSYGGLREVARHLIEVHGHHRIAFIRGPAGHREAIERLRAYEDALSAAGLAYDPRLVTPPGAWEERWGEAAARILLEERRVDCDAIIAANDNLALGALNALTALGVRVPDDIALTGFNNQQAGRIQTPALTTVPIRMRQRGRQAVAMLTDLLSGKAVPDQVLLPTHLVVRQSCGCPDALVARAGKVAEMDRGGATAAPGTASTAVEGEPPADLRVRTLGEMDRELETVEERLRGVGELLDAFLSDPGAGQSGVFLSTLARLLGQAAQAHADVFAWHGAIDVLRRRFLPGLADDPEHRERAEDLWHQARVMIGERAWRAQAAVEWHAGQLSERVHDITRALLAAQDTTELMDALARALPSLGVDSCCIALFDNPQSPDGSCKVVLAQQSAGAALTIAAGEVCSAPHLASAGGLRAAGQTSLVVLPLYYPEHPLGFMIADGNRSDGQLYRVLQQQVSTALRGALLMQENTRLYVEAVRAQAVAEEGRRLAEEADRLKSRFLSVVSHELRTPLVLLEGLSEMMLREGLSSRPALPDPYRQDLARIHASSQQLGGLVRDVLELARCQTGQLRLQQQTLDLASLLRTVALVGEQMAHGKGLRWQVDIPADLPEVVGDATRLQQVALNLLANAAKFTDTGELRLGAEVYGDWVTISISDTGLGVPLEEQQVIFDEYRQSERTSARAYGGLGVGLAICRELVTLHGGTIGVRSSGEEGEGSTFYFTLPVACRDQLSGPEGEAQSHAVVVLAEEGRVGSQLLAYLAQRGFLVEMLQLDTNDEWRCALSANPPGAIVLDVQAASERAWQLIEWLKQNPATQQTPILFCALPADGSGGSMLSLDYVSKPMGGAELARALQRLGLEDGGRTKGQAILLVDDDPQVLAMHARIVRAQFPRSQVLTAANGLLALEAMRAETPALVLLDLMMPEMDGIGVIERMQQDERLRDVPVIVLTAQSLALEQMVSFSRGVVAVLEKGVFTPEETLAHIGNALAANRRLGTETQRLVRKAMAYIHEHYAEPITREDLAAQVGVSGRHLTRCFAEELNLSPGDYLNRYRIMRARELLRRGDMSITLVMEATGFADSSHFARVFRREVGMSPSAYQRGLRLSE